MLNLNDLKETIIGSKTKTCDLNNDEDTVLNIFSKFPINDNDQLECITQTLQDQNIGQLVIIYW